MHGPPSGMIVHWRWLSQQSIVEFLAKWGKNSGTADNESQEYSDRALRDGRDIDRCEHLANAQT